MASLSIASTDPFGPVRLAARVAALAVVLLLCLPPHYLWKALRQASPWPRLFLAAASRICGARVTRVGQPIRSDVFYVANHLSWLDIPIIGGTTGTAFVSQDGIEKSPVIGWLAALNHTVFVSRSDRLSIDTQIAELRAAIAEQQPITVFPEGTTTDGGSLLPFKPSLFAVMAPPPKPMLVQPVLLDYGAAGPEIAWIGEEAGDDNALRVLKRRGGFDVRVEFLEPFDPAACANRKAIATEARNRIAAALSASLGGRAIL